MQNLIVRALIISVAVCSMQSVWADEKLPPPRVIDDGSFQLPPVVDNYAPTYPHIVPPHHGGNLFLPARPVYPQHGKRSIWRAYGVDHTGNFRARVIVSPYGGYYYYNRAPYPWTSTRPELYRGMIYD